jgi:uroporphyrinogen-III synthase
MRYLALENRRAKEIAELIRRQGGDPFVAPAMREIPLENNENAIRFAERLFAGDFDMIVFLTGVGVRVLHRVISARYDSDALLSALRKVTIVARGPKPVAVLREMNVPVTLQPPEPNTWRELLAITEGRPERRIAVQEYGRSNAELLDAFRARGAEVTPVRVYQWDLPEDDGPLREAARRLASGDFDVVLFTSGAQVDHLFQIARDMGTEEEVRRGLERAVVGSIGPTTTEAMEEYGLKPSIEPSHPKMGFLVKETAEFAARTR